LGMRRYLQTKGLEAYYCFVRPAEPRLDTSSRTKLVILRARTLHPKDLNVVN